MTKKNPPFDRRNENNAFNLLPPSLERVLPKLYATEKTPLEEKIAYAKFFAPNTNWTWYVLEGEWQEEDEDYLFFGYVEGFEKEYGYFSLNELESVINPFCKVERDLYFEPKELSEYIQED
jgi:hypothetical protein